jgi:2,3-diketo-5-methylthio-1-phosphopentane phosphatase
MQNLAFVTDFDGTVTDDDFFVYVQHAFLDDAALAPWWQYRKGELSHFDALAQIYGTLRAPEAALRQLVDKVHVCPHVIPTFELLHNSNIPIYIASAGCDYYIRILLGAEIDKFGVTLITNPSGYTADGGLFMQRPPEDSPFYCHATGISKACIVNYLHEKGSRVIFAGDGPPDIEPARLADVVFARKHLLEACEACGIQTRPFNNYEDIYRYFEKELKK